MLPKYWRKQSSSSVRFWYGVLELWKLPNQYWASHWYEAYKGYAGIKTDPFQKLWLLFRWCRVEKGSRNNLKWEIDEYSIVTLQACKFMQIHLYLELEDIFLCKISSWLMFLHCNADSVGVHFVDICTLFLTHINEYKVKAVELWPPAIMCLSYMLPW